MEQVLLCAPAQPGGSVSEAPEEGQVGPHIDPAAHHHGLVLQNRGLVDQPVELHRSLDLQGEHLRGHGCLTFRHDHEHLKPKKRQL